MDTSYLQPGLTFVRSAIARAYSKTSSSNNALAYADSRWGRDSNVVNVIRAAVSGGESSTGDWSGLTDLNASAREFLDAVAPMTIIGKLEGLRKVPPNAQYVRSAGNAVAHWVGESKAIPLSPAAFDRATMRALKIGCLVVMSADVLANPSPEAESMIRRDMLRAVAVLSDMAFIDPTSAGTAGVAPASVTHGATSVSSTGDLSDDLAQAIDAFHGDFSTSAWVLSPRLAARIVLAAGGKGLGTGLGLRGGELLGLPALVSASSPSSTDGGSLALVDASNIVVVDEGADIAISEEATVEMDDAPTGSTDTPTGASQRLVNLFQANAVGFKVTRRINWAANTGAVVVITGADYASA